MHFSEYDSLFNGPFLPIVLTPCQKKLVGVKAPKVKKSAKLADLNLVGKSDFEIAQVLLRKRDKSASELRADKVDRMAAIVAANVPHNGKEYHYQGMEAFLKSIDDDGMSLADMA